MARGFEEIESIAFGDVPLPEECTVLEYTAIYEFGLLIQDYRNGKIMQEQATSKKAELRGAYESAQKHKKIMHMMGDAIATATLKLHLDKADETFSGLAKDMGEVSRLSEPDEMYREMMVLVMDGMEKKYRQSL